MTDDQTDSPSSFDATDDETLIRLALLWEESWEHGIDRTAEQLCGDRTELIEPLRRRIDSLKTTAWMNDPLGTSPTVSTETSASDEAAGIDSLPDRYEVRRLLGRGGHGAVFEAFDKELERTVAIKKTVSTDGSIDLLDEARRVAKLRHPSIVRVLDVIRIDSGTLIVSEFIEGETLADVIARGPLPVKKAVDIAATVAEALAFAHQQDIVHRDVKPSNILLDSGGRPHLSDFGIASTNGIADPVFAGTLRYASPEQVRDGETLIDGRTDIYSLGVVLFEMLTGKSPYTARTASALREQVLFHAPPPLTTLRDDVPEELADIVSKSLAKHPVERFLTAGEMATQLRTPHHPSPASISRRQAIMGGVAVLGGTVAVATGFAVGRFGQPSRSKEATAVASKGVFRRDGYFHFDGRTRVRTNVKRTLPVTLEAWIRPDPYKDENGQWIIGGDIPGHYGISLGLAGSMLIAEYRSGTLSSPVAVPPNRWSHVAATFRAEETALFLNGQPVASGPGSTVERETRFVIGNVGENNLIDFYHGDIRSARISSGVRYDSEFIANDLERDSTTLMLIDKSTREEAGILIDENGRPLGQVETY